MIRLLYAMDNTKKKREQAISGIGEVNKHVFTTICHLQCPEIVLE